MTETTGLDWETLSETRQAVSRLNSLIRDCGDYPDGAADFAETLSEKVLGVLRLIDESRQVTEEQLNAIESWEEEVGKW